MHVRRADTQEELAACIAIRHRVFIQEQGVPEADEIDGLDHVCRHFLATPEKGASAHEAFGTARLLFLDDGTAKAQRVAVLPTHRRCGAGAALMFALEGEAARARYGVVVLASQLQAVPFYLHLGYEVHGEVFLDAGIEHCMMSKAVL